MKNKNYLAFICSLAFTIGLYFSPLIPMVLSTFALDTIGHFVGFFLLSWLLYNLINISLVSTCLCMMFYGGLSEIGQYYLGFRNGEVRDFIADVFGVLLFAVVASSYRYFKKRPAL